LSVPQPPTVPCDGLDGAAASQISQALNEVRSSPRSDQAWGKLGLALEASEFKTEAVFCFEQAERFGSSKLRWPYFQALLLRQDHPEKAITKFQRAVELNRPQSDIPRLRFAQFLAERGKLREAEGHFQELLRSNPNHGPALLGLARLSFTEGRLQESTEYLKRCLENVHVARSAYLLLTTVQQRLGNVRAAQGAAEIAATLPPDQTWPDPFAKEAAEFQVARQALIDRGLQLVKQGRLQEALPLVTRVVQQYPQDAEAWLLLGRLRLQQKDCREAERAIRRHLALSPESVNGCAQLGMALLCLERYPDAAAAFEKAVQLKPDFGEAHFNRGFALARMGQGAEAMQSFREAIRCTPNFIEPYITLADLLSQSGQKEEALFFLNRALELNPADERAKVLSERVRQRQQD
jgi:tetratricopeptide (TPR) repeat protein